MSGDPSGMGLRFLCVAGGGVGLCEQGVGLAQELGSGGVVERGETAHDGGPELRGPGELPGTRELRRRTEGRLGSR